jgi:hypothetical protein
MVRKPERKRPLGRPGHRWENNIKIGNRIEDMDCIHLA